MVLLGMGGSSLAPEVLRRAFGSEHFHVLDTTHPQAIRAVQAKLDLERTLFISASKSGGTLETRSHTDYFWKLAPRGRQWVAITDPGSELEQLANEREFARDLPRRADDRRPLLGALGVRARAGGAARRRPAAPARARAGDGGGMPARPGQPRSRARPVARPAVGGGPRQGLRPRPARVRPVGRAARGGVDRQGGQGPRADAGRVARRPRPAGAGGAARGAVRARPGVLPLGVRRRRRRLDPRHQPLRPAERAGREGQDERGARRRRRRARRRGVARRAAGLGRGARLRLHPGVRRPDARLPTRRSRGSPRAPARRRAAS